MNFLEALMRTSPLVKQANPGVPATGPLNAEQLKAYLAPFLSSSAAVPGMLGAAAGAGFGGLFPGHDEEGKQKSRLLSALGYGALGGLGGYAAGSFGGGMGMLGGLSGGMRADEAARAQFTPAGSEMPYQQLPGR